MATGSFHARVFGFSLVYLKGVLSVHDSWQRIPYINLPIPTFNGLELHKDILTAEDGDLCIRSKKWAGGQSLVLWMFRRRSEFGYFIELDNIDNRGWGYRPW